jgi:chromosome segregation ATPase
MVLLSLLAGGIFSSSAMAQVSARERAASLRTQLSEVQAKQNELQTRLEQVEENLKPENIANSLAGVGSTHPEELREQRRRQLEIERTGIRGQIDQLSISRTRLEKSVAEAEVEVYHQSAGVGVSGTQPQTNRPPINAHPSQRTTNKKIRKSKTRRRS